MTVLIQAIKCGNQSLYSIASPGAPSQLRLKLLADEAVNRIGTAAADREEEAYCADQQHILVSPTARCITFRQMHEQQGHQHLDGQRRRDKTREQTMIKQMPPTDSMNMMTYAHINEGSMPFLANTFAATASAPSLNFVETCIKNIMPTTMRTSAPRASPRRAAARAQ
jgi:hypothetical protein